MHFEEWMEHVVHGFEIVGIAVLAVGSIIGIVRGAALLRQGDEHAAYRRVRHDIGQSILLGLEILIIADIVLTITIDPTLESALALALIVLVRTFLSFSLEIELDGVVPWHKGRQTERSDAAPAP
jgi:uncharacterized membrane protein